MTLAEYLFYSKISQRTLAKKTRLSLAIISGVVTRKRIPNLETALRIYFACKGKIELESMLPIDVLKNIQKDLEY